MEEPPIFMYQQNTVKMATLVKATYRFNATPTKIPVILFKAIKKKSSTGSTTKDSE
jgi:hypothetical protein